MHERQTWFPGIGKTQVQVKKENAGLEDLTLGIGEQVHKYRKLQGLTQSGLAEKIGRTRTSVTNIEKGNQNISLQLLFDLAEALDCEIQIELRLR